MSQRRLAAIMFTDIVGYASLLKENEKKAFETLRKNQRIHRRLIKKFNGRWLKEMGGGILASFNSNIDAAMCAVSIQKATTEVEIPVRIGIHLGDVIFEKKDVLGDGVNLASRIQNAINTSGIVVSEKVYSDIKNKEGLEIEFLGEQALKGVSKPIGIYKVTCQDDSLLDFTIDTGELVRPLSFGRSSLVAGILIIAILAFSIYYFIPKATPTSEIKKKVLLLPPENYLGTDSLDYVVAGMHDALIGDIGKIGALNVISRTTALAYKKEGKSILEMALEYNIDYIVESSVLCYDDSVCTQFKVFDEEENELSVQDFSVEKSQILNLYKIITKDIAKRINVVLTPEQERLLSKTRTVNREAYDEYLKARSYWIDSRQESLFKAIEYLNKAIEKEPDWAPLYAGLAEVWLMVQQGGWEPSSVTAPIIYTNLNRAMELDPNLAEIHYVSALIAHLVEWDFAKSEKEFLKTLAINPNDPLARLFYAQLLLILHRNEESRAQRELAISLDPLSPNVQLLYLGTLMLAGDYKAVLSVGEEYLAAHPTDMSVNFLVGLAAYSLGDYDKVVRTWKYSCPFLMVGDVYEGIVNIYNESGIVAAHKELMVHYEKYAENNPDVYTDMIWLYLGTGQIDKALDWIEKAFEMHHPQITYIAIDKKRRSPIEEELYKNPRFIAICEKANLPLP